MMEASNPLQVMVLNDSTNLSNFFDLLNTVCNKNEASFLSSLSTLALFGDGLTIRTPIPKLIQNITHRSIKFLITYLYKTQKT